MIWNLMIGALTFLIFLVLIVLAIRQGEGCNLHSIIAKPKRKGENELESESVTRVPESCSVNREPRKPM
jgi:hypothetical protein